MNREQCYDRFKALDKSERLCKCPMKENGWMCVGDECMWWVVRSNPEHESCAISLLASDLHEVASLLRDDRGE